MRLLFALAAIISTAFAQDRTDLKGPAWGWIERSPSWAAKGVTGQAPEGAIHALPEIRDDEFQYFTTDDSDRVLLLTLRSDGAMAMRVHFENFRLPEGAKLYVYGLDGQNQVTRVSGPYRGAGPDHSGEFWTRSLPGSRVAVELQMNDEIATLPFSIQEIATQDSIEEIEGVLESGKPVERRV
ncbi:MAG: hypothetical protein JNK48_26050 [Bryobacterales bacterium]|nr:hypothetical protein [Bryobacterales bacterium]